MSELQIHPLTDNVGATVTGLDMRRDLTADETTKLADAFSRFGLLLFRGLDIDVAQQLRLAHVFGEPVIREKNVAPDPNRQTQHVSNALADGVFGTGELDFHIDQLFWPEPLKALMLYGIEIPSSGSETKFVDTNQVYARMPNDLKHKIDGLSCRHAYTFAGKLAEDWHVKDADTQDMSVVHPIV